MATPPAATAVPGHRLAASLGNGPGHGIGKGEAILAVVLNEPGGQDEAISPSVAHLDGVGILDAGNALGPVIGATGGGIQSGGRGAHGILDARRLGDALNTKFQLKNIFLKI